MEKHKKFLNILYDNMASNGFIKKEILPKDRDEKIKYAKSFLNKLKLVENELINNKKVDLIKKSYYNRYVIKEENIPNHYYEKQAKIMSNRGFGNIELNDTIKHKYAINIINNQKKSLERIIDYFYSVDLKYFDYELKYWAFQGIIKMSKYDKLKNEFTRRSNNTIEPFIDINFEALYLTIEIMNKYLNNKEVNIDLIKYLETANFAKIYGYYINNINKYKNNYHKSTTGKWIKYNKGSNCKNLVESIIGKSTNWCSVSETTAQMQLDDGDIYIYYTKDNNNDYTIPRLCIRMNNNKVEEVRGVLKYQHIELELTEQIDNKLKEFSNYLDYKERILDSKRLKIILDKLSNNIDLDKEEYDFINETKRKITGFGYFDNPYVEIIKQKLKNKSFNVSNKKIK